MFDFKGMHILFYIFFSSIKQNQTIHVLRKQIVHGPCLRNIYTNLLKQMQKAIAFENIHDILCYQPVYLRELIHPYSSSRNTRRSSPKLKFLQTPTFDRKVHKSMKHFSNSFSHYAPSLWNSFPLHVRNSPSVVSFRKHLKTHICSSSFPT